MEAQIKSLKKTLTGKVVSNKMEKTVVVEVIRSVMHPIYKKYIKKRKKFMAHDPDNSLQIGDEVLIEECRPLSRRKRWIVKEIIKKAEQK